MASEDKALRWIGHLECGQTQEELALICISGSVKDMSKRVGLVSAGLGSVACSFLWGCNY